MAVDGGGGATVAGPNLVAMRDSEELKRLGRIIKALEGLSPSSLRWLSERIGRLIEQQESE